MCPVRLFAQWWKLSNGKEGGFVFWKKIGTRFSVDPMDRMACNSLVVKFFLFLTENLFPQSSEAFLECFRKNLCYIGVDPQPYGTHSFRRGGCQYLAMVLHWPF